MNFLLAVYNLNTLKTCKEFIDSAVLMTPNYSQVYEDDFNLDLAIKYCEENSIEPIISINRIFMENELDEIKTFILKYQRYSFIISDLGIIEIFKELNLINQVIYDSSTMVCNSLDCGYYNSFGFKATSMSNEIPVADVVLAHKFTKAEIMYQVFGRKLMFYSKRRLVSCYEDHRNIKLERNGLFIKEEKRSELMPIIENNNGYFVYRSYFISLLEEMQRLSFLKYAYFESLTLKDEEMYLVLKAFRENNKLLLEKLNLDIKDGFAYLDTIHVKEKIINEKN